MKIKITHPNPKGYGTLVSNADTGEQIDGVRSAELRFHATEEPSLLLELVNFEFEGFFEESQYSVAKEHKIENPA